MAEKKDKEEKDQQKASDSNAPNFTIRADQSLEWGGDPYQRSALNKRHADFLGNQLHADMWFHVLNDDVRIPAHRLIICTASPVLESIAYGTGDIPGSIGDVPVPDCCADNFYEVLRFVYTGCVNLTSDNVADILLLAHYYNLQSLVDECVASLLSTLSVHNVCDTLGKIHLLDINEPKEECLRIIRNNTDELFAEDGQNLFNMDVTVLRQVFQMGALRIDSDVDLFEELLKWGRLQCLANDQTPTGQHLRAALDGRLDFVRFAAMTFEQFAKCVRMVDDQFFTDGETSTTFRRIAQCKTNGNDNNAIGLTHYNQSRELQLADAKVLRLNLGHHITEYEVKMTFESNICVHGFDGMPAAAFTLEWSDKVFAEFIPVGVKLYGNRALFDKPITFPASACVRLKFKYAYEVLATNMLCKGFCCTSPKLIVNFVDTYATFSAVLYSKVKYTP